jgi:hypothetical protein
MEDIPIPFTGEEVDTDSGLRGIAVTVGVVIVGFAVLSWSQGVGDYLASKANSFVTSSLGFDPTSGEDSGADLL